MGATWMSNSNGSTRRREQVREEARRRRIERGDTYDYGSGTSSRNTTSYSERLKQSDARTSRVARSSSASSSSQRSTTSSTRRLGTTTSSTSRGSHARSTSDSARDHSSSANRYSTSGATAVRRSYTDRSQSKGLNFKLIILITIAVVLLVAVIWSVTYCMRVSSNLHAGVDDDLRAALVKTDMANEPFYMLLLGTDASQEREDTGDFGGNYRSDSMILARIDAPNQTVTLISIHRDTVYDFGGEWGEQKINAAYAIGGPALAVQAVSDLAGVPISHYAEINFDAFIALVDTLGGIEVDVPIDIDDEDAEVNLVAGVQVLNGHDALGLARARSVYNNVAGDPDEMRAANQRMVIAAIARELLSADVATIAATVEELSKYVTTTLEINDIIGLAQAFQGIDPSTNIYSAMMPVVSDYHDDLWWEYVDEDKWEKMKERVDAGLPPTETDVVDEVSGVVLATAGGVPEDSTKYAYVAVWNGTDREGVGTEAGDILEKAGYIHVYVDSADSTDYAETIIYFDDPAQEFGAKELAKTLGQGRVVQNTGEVYYDDQFLVIIGADWESPN